MIMRIDAMKKCYIFTLLALSIVGCRNFEETPVELKVESDPGYSASFEIFATINQDEAKTSLDNNGYTLKWSEKDSIEVYFSYKALLTSGSIGTLYKLHSFTLASKADTSAGTFKCNTKITALHGNPEYKPMVAVYPAGGTLYVDEKKTPVYYENVLGNTLVLDSPRDISKGDIRATSSFAEANFSTKGDPYNVGTYFSAKCNFKELGTLLDFEITPTSDMVKDKDVIKSISLSTQNSKVAGTYNIDFTNSDVSISVEDKSFANQMMTLSFKDKSVVLFNSSSPVEYLMTILPGVKKGEKLFITIVTDKRTININTSAAKDFLSGCKYRMPLPLPDIPESNISIIVPDKFTSINDKLGKFAIDNSGNVQAIYSDDDSGVQYGYHNNKCRFQNWDKGTITFLTIPYGTVPQVGSTINVSESVLNGSSSSKDLKVVMRVGTRYWLKSTDGTIGYIISIDD